MGEVKKVLFGQATKLEEACGRMMIPLAIIVIIGSLMNILVITSNGGLMPVVFLNPCQIPDKPDGKHCTADESTNFTFLSDWIYSEAVRSDNLFIILLCKIARYPVNDLSFVYSSPGDILMQLGLLAILAPMLIFILSAIVRLSSALVKTLRA